MVDNGANIDTPKLKLPAIGRFGTSVCLNTLGKNIVFPKVEDNVKEAFELALGDYLLESGESGYKNIIDLLFPGRFKLTTEALRNIVLNGNIEGAPLFTWVFAQEDYHGNQGQESARTNQLRSAWAQLMLDLGEFKLDEHFKVIAPSLENYIQYTISINDEPEACVVLNACFLDSREILQETWNRLTEDTLVVFIDDNKEFSHRWGLEIKNNIPVEDVADSKIYSKNSSNLMWLKPSGNNYDPSETQKKTREIVNKFKENAGINKLVFVVDLLYKKDNIHCIEGDNLIRFLRKDIGVDALIIGFTGGQSPFIIDSAVKAGADNVIMKEQGKNFSIGSSHVGGNSSGLFNLLWALSKNINRWRFLESYREMVKDCYEAEASIFTYQTILDKLFFSIENESPFWRKYLRDWRREMEDLRIKWGLFRDR